MLLIKKEEEKPLSWIFGTQHFNNFIKGRTDKYQIKCRCLKIRGPLKIPGPLKTPGRPKITVPIIIPAPQKSLLKSFSNNPYTNIDDNAIHLIREKFEETVSKIPQIALNIVARWCRKSEPKEEIRISSKAQHYWERLLSFLRRLNI